jgi:Skp family chaperone for outer membrane proteins
VKRILTSALAFAILTGSFTMTQTANAQTKSAAQPHKVGLIDMAYVFQEYEKFKVLRQDLKAEIERSDTKAKQFMTQSQTLQAKLKEFKSGSADYIKYEKLLLTLKAEFDGYRASAQRDLMRRESKIYKQVYMDVSAAVKEYCKHYDYTLVMRFNRKSVSESDAPNDIVQGMNRQVVFFQTQDDITDRVLLYLNKNYGKPAAQQVRGRSSGTPATPTSARRPTTNR